MHVDDIEIDAKSVLHVGDLNVVLNGIHGFVCLNRYSPIGRSYMFYGEHAENEIAFCRAFIPEGGCVIDVGAHQGTHALAFTRAVGNTGTVISFEPQRQMYQNILATAALNSLPNLYTFNAAVGKEAGSVRIAEYDYAKRGHFSGMRIRDENVGERVVMVTLDDVLTDHDAVTRIDFLKIDVEGYEAQVLEGARKIIEKFDPVIYHEFHTNDPSRSIIMEFMASIGFKTYLHAPHGYNPQNLFGYQGDRFQGGRDHNAVSVSPKRAQEFKDVLQNCDVFEE